MPEPHQRRHTKRAAGARAIPLVLGRGKDDVDRAQELASACGDLKFGQALASRAMSSGTNSPRETKAARADDSPASRLQRKLRVVAPATYAGLVMEPDRSLIVYATVIEPALSAAIAEVQAATAGGVSVRVISGQKNSLAVLDGVRDQITARQRDLGARGVNLTQWGPDIVANRVRIGVRGLTPEIGTELAREFGADQVLVVEGALWHAV